MKYEPVKGKLKVNLKSEGGSFNANQFRPKNIEPHYQTEYSTYLDNSLQSGDFKERQSGLSYDSLEYVAKQVAPIAAIINTRIDQVGLFTGRSRHNENGIGFKVRLKDLSKKPTEAQLRTIEHIEEFILNCGNGEDRSRDNFDTFLRKITRDSLTYDQVNFEITYDMWGNIEAFYNVDPKTIKPATLDYEPTDEVIENSSSQVKSKDIDDAIKKLKGEEITDEEDNISFVQVVDGKPISSFSSGEMAFAVRNPQSNVRYQPYGISEIESIIKQLTSYIQTEDYNMRYFKQGGMTKGILNIKEPPQGIADRHVLESFKRQWRTQVTGSRGAWKIPVFNLPGELEFINLQQSGGEMVFEKWMNYLINIACAVYRIDPAEINFPNNGGAGGKGNSLFNNNSDKIEASKAKGLQPLMQFIQNTINTYIVSKFSNEYVFSFDGLNDDSEESRISLDKEKSSSIMTINEVRQERGLPKLEGGDIIANPYFMQGIMQGGGESFDFDIEDEEVEEEIDKSLSKSSIIIEEIYEDED